MLRIPGLPGDTLHAHALARLLALRAAANEPLRRRAGSCLNAGAKNASANTRTQHAAGASLLWLLLMLRGARDTRQLTTDAAQDVAPG